MKEYMVVCLLEGKTFSIFVDTYSEAKDKKMDIECGLGGYAEIYGREEHEDGDFKQYVFLEA